MSVAAVDTSLAAPIAVRPAGLADRALLRDILQKSYPVLMARSYPRGLLGSVMPILTTPNDRLLTAGTFFIAYSGDRPVGCGGWSPERPGGNGEREEGLAHIRHFATIAEAVGSGVGRALYNRCELEADVLGYSEFEVFSSLNAEGFYQALGFQGVAQIDLPFPGGVTFPSVRMRRVL